MRTTSFSLGPDIQGGSPQGKNQREKFSRRQGPELSLTAITEDHDYLPVLPAKVRLVFWEWTKDARDGAVN